MTAFEGAWERRALVWLVPLKLAGMVLLLDLGGLSTFDLAKSGWSRGATWLMAAALLLLLLRFGRAVVPPTRLHALVAAYLVVAALATLFAAHQYTALFGERTRYLGLTFIVDMAVLYAAVAVAVRSRRDWAIVAGGLGVIALVECVYVALQAADRDPLGWRISVELRAFGTLGNADPLARFLACAASAAGGAAVFLSGWRLRAAAASVAVASLAALGPTGTRGVVVGLGVAALVVAALWVRTRGLAAARRPLLAAGGALAIVGTLALVLTPIGARVAQTLGGLGVTERLDIYRTALRVFAARPLLGWGPDNLAVAWPGFREPATEAFHRGEVAIDQAHNWLLHAAATTGVIGAAALALVYAAAAVILWRRFDQDRPLAAALLAALAAYVFELFAIENVGVSWIPWLAVGGAASLAGRAHPAVAPVRRIAMLVPAGLAAIALAGAASGLSAQLANQAARRADLAYGALDAARTTAEARAAVAYDPGRGEHWNYLGLGLMYRRLWADAAASFEEAARRAPHQANYWSNIALARAGQALAGDASGGGKLAALAAAERAVAVDPNYSRPHYYRADIALRLGEPDLALREVVAAIRLNPGDPAHEDPARRGDPAHDDLAARAAAAHPSPPLARALLEEALRAKPSSATLRAALAALPR